jgi:Protein of unknown function (DUF2510)
MQPQPPAGWYPDPDDPARTRYWDGAAWSEPEQTEPTAVLGAPEPSGSNRRRNAIAAAAGVAGLLVGAGVGVVAQGPAETKTTTVTTARTETVTTSVTKTAKAKTVTVTQTVTDSSSSAYERGPGSGCDKNYSGCVPANVGHVVCEDIVGPVKVIGRDHYALDPDGDGVACEK